MSDAASALGQMTATAANQEFSRLFDVQAYFQAYHGIRCRLLESERTLPF